MIGLSSLMFVWALVATAGDGTGEAIARTPPGDSAAGSELLDERPPEAEPQGLSAEALCRRGDHHLEDGGRTAALEARSLFEQATRVHPDEPCGHSGLARALATLHARRIEEDDSLPVRAIEEARRAIEISPGSALAHAALASALLADLRPQEADASIATALAIEPELVPALQTAAAIRLTQGNHEEAKSFIDRAIRLRPDLPASYHIRGNAQVLSDQRIEAISSYRDALRLSPDFVPSMLQLGSAYELLGNYPAASRVFEDLQHRHPEELRRINLYMGHSLMKRSQWAPALGALRKVEFKTHKGLSNGTVLYLKGRCHEELGQDELAKQAFREVIDKWPEATGGPTSVDRVIDPAYEALGRIHLKAHETEAAQSILEEGVARAGASVDLHLSLARLYLDYGLRERAMGLAEKVCSRELNRLNASGLLSACVLWGRLGREAGDSQAMLRLTSNLQGHDSRLASLSDYPRDLDAMRALSLAGRGDLALQILRRGVQAGYAQPEWVATDPDLEDLRATRGYHDLLRGGRTPASPGGAHTSD